MAKIKNKEKIHLYFRMQEISVTKMRLLYCKERLKRVGDFVKIHGIKQNGTEGELLLDKATLNWIVDKVEAQEIEMLKDKTTAGDKVVIHYDASGNMIFDTK